MYSPAGKHTSPRSELRPPADTRPIAEGGMRWCMKMEFTDQHGRTESYVGKIFKPNEHAYMQARQSALEVFGARGLPPCVQCHG